MDGKVQSLYGEDFYMRESRCLMISKQLPLNVPTHHQVAGDY